MSEAAGYEVELKFRLDVSADEITRRIDALGGEFLDEIPQDDYYFNHPVRDFAETDEAFRIRRVGDLNCITWKGPKVDTETKTRREIEIPLGDGSDVSGQFAEVLAILGFRSVACVRKTRRRFRLNWQDDTFELAMDNVDGVGLYLEIELLADESTLKEAQAAVVDLSRELGLSQPEKRSYLELFLETQNKA